MFFDDWFVKQKHQSEMSVFSFDKFDYRRVSAGEQADWTKHFRDNAMLTSPSRGLYNWFAVTPQRNARECRQFIELLIRSAGGMRFKIERPRE